MSNLPLIDSNQALQDYCEVLSSRDVIALDTEFLRVRTFYPKPGLFQVNDGENIALIDPLAIDEWQDFSAILANPAIVKVLHACDEDIELFYHFLQVKPQNIFDTQVAAAFCGYDFCMGYQRLVAAMFDTHIEKTESRSDWMRRPLTANQLEYAANDVFYLIDMYQRLSTELASNQHAAAVKDECDRVFLTVSNKDFSRAYKRVKQAWKLNARQFSVLKALATWREQIMREEDIPRNKVAKNDALMILAQKNSWLKKQLFAVDGLPPATVEAFSEQLLMMVNESENSSPKTSEVMAKPVKSDPLFNRLKQALKDLAEQQGIAEKMLSKKAYNEALYYQMKRGGQHGGIEIDCWRQPFYQQVLAHLSQAK